MAEKFSYGIKSLIVADIDPATGLALAGTEVELEPNIYRDTFDITEEEGTTTDHYAEMIPDPKISFKEPGKDVGTFQIMDTQADMLVLFLGGTVTEDAGPPARKTWSKSKTAVNIEKFMKLTTPDNTEIIMPRCQMSGRKVFQIRRNQIWVIEVTVTPLAPKFEDLSAMDVIEDM